MTTLFPVIAFTRSNLEMKGKMDYRVKPDNDNRDKIATRITCVRNDSGVATCINKRSQ